MSAGMRRHAILLVGLLFLAAAAFQPPFVRAATAHAEDVAATAVIAYGALRAINAAISVAKETEFSVPVVGAFGAKPGMALDPIDETVARISDAVFLVLAVTATLTLAFSPIAKVGALLVAGSLLVIWLARYFAFMRPIDGVAGRLAMLGLLLALVVPASFAAGGWLGKLATAEQLTAARAALEEASGQVDSDAVANAGLPAADPLPWWRFWSGSEANSYTEGEAQTWFGEYTQRAETILKSSLTIIGVYLLRLLVFPAVALGVLLIVVRQALAGLVAPTQPPLRTT